MQVAYNVDFMKNQIEALAKNMKAHGRGYLPQEVENKIISELEKIWLTMAERASGSKENIHGHKGLEILQNLVGRMELDFSHKLALDLKHDVERDLEIGKIKIAFLDGIRRVLSASRGEK